MGSKQEKRPEGLVCGFIAFRDNLIQARFRLGDGISRLHWRLDWFTGAAKVDNRVPLLIACGMCF